MMTKTASFYLLAFSALVTEAKFLSKKELQSFYGTQTTGVANLLKPLDASQTLREAAEALGIYIGAAINVGCLTNSSDKQYSYIAGSELNLFTAENECKVGETEPQQGHYTYTSCEFIANFAATNKGVMRNHNTVWGSYNPGVSFLSQTTVMSMCKLCCRSSYHCVL